MDIRCAQACVILSVISGTMSLKVIDQMSIRIRGRRTFEQSENPQEISQDILRHGGTRDPIGVDMYTTLHNGYGGRVSESREDYPGNLFALSFLWKDKIPLTHCSRSK